MKIICTDKAPAAIGPYSQAVETGGFMFCSGQIALDPLTGEFKSGTAEQETELVMENLKGLLESAGLGLDQVIKTTIFLVDMDDFARVNQIYGQYFNDCKPARSTVAVAALPRGAKVEIEAVAACKN